jgi:uncharacterized protein (DUF1697 family)
MRYISILRGINVGGNRKILMNDLKSLFEKLGFGNVQTFIQSGNVVFESEKKYLNADVEQRIQLAIAKTFGFDVPVIVLTGEEIAESISNNPFLKEKDPDIEKLHLTILKEEPSNQLVKNIEGFKSFPDRFEIIGKNVFIYCENGYGRTKITNDFFEKKLKIPATTRNWKTMMKLHEMALSKI